MIYRYDSISALRAKYLALRPKDIINADISWYGNETEETTLFKTENGDTTLVPLAELAISKLELAIETPRKLWQRAPAGAFCSVPDVLAGLPTPMRRQSYAQDETAPISIFVDVGSHVDVSAKTLAKRGTIILALVLALTRIRPVALFQLHCGSGQDGETITISQINTSPLDLATACYILTSAGFARRLVYNLAARLNRYNGHFPRNFDTLNQNLYYDQLKPKITPDPTNCLIIGKALTNDELLREPILWLNKQIARFTTQQEELTS